MSESTEATNLTELIQTMEQMEREAPRVSVDDIVDAVGRRSFGPLLLIAGLITLAPVIGDIPGMPTLMAALVLLVSTQLLAGRKTFWLPKWLLNRSVSRKGFDKAIHALKKPAQWVDNLLGMRLKWMTGYAGIRATALACLLVAVAMPPMEFIPFSANGAGLALTLFGLGLVARDGL
ncbi:MAG: exopolysaccharide biosynthesis protein, partial [Halomonas sp.]